MRILCLMGTGDHQRALAHRLHAVAPLVEIGLIGGTHTPEPPLIQRVAALTIGWPLRKAWSAVLQQYARRYPELPPVPVTVHYGVNAESVLAQIARVRPDLVLVSGTDLLRQPLIDAIQLHGRVMNLHTGLSPYIRGGPNSTNWALALGDFHLIGNTVMWLDAGIDSGSIIATERTPLDGTESITGLHLKVMEHAHDLYCRCVRRFVDGSLVSGTPQREVGKGRLFLNRHWTGRRMLQAVYNFYARFGPTSLLPQGSIRLVPLVADAGSGTGVTGPVTPSPDHNQRTYESEQVVSFYERQSELQDSEAYLFSKYIPSGAAVLDMGVGGGRTTPALSSRSSRYVGADYSHAMVEACARRFPGLDFRHCDATNMAQFADGEFDAMVFSFNGIDYINDDAGRARCLAETSRVLKPGGVFIFSSHHARQLGIWPTYEGAKPHQAVWRTARALGKSVAVAWRTLRSGAFQRGEGYIQDPVHGGNRGIRTYVSTPRAFERQLAEVGLRTLEVVRGPDPALRSDLVTSWHYYACVKEPAAPARSGPGGMVEIRPPIHPAAAAAKVPATARVYRSLFLDDANPHQRYYGWNVAEDRPGVRVLRKRYGMVTRSLVLLAGAGRGVAEDAVRKACDRSPLSDVVIHDFDAILADPPMLAGLPFYRASAAERLLNTATFVIDLMQDETALFGALSADYRRKIRKAESSGLVVEVHDRPDAGLLASFAAEYAVLAQDRGLAPVKTTVLEQMYAGGNALMLVARRGSKITNYLHLYTTKDTALFMYGVNPARENDGAGQYLHWEAIRALRQRGFAWYDLGGVATVDPSNGIYSFKERFGGQLVMLGPEWRYVAVALKPMLATSRLLRWASFRSPRP